jgi:hypothetical protein
MKTLFFFLIPCFPFFSQIDASNLHFNTLISVVYGDLNQDNIPDIAMVTQDTLNENAPYRLEIFFTQENGDKKLIVRTDKAIEAQFPNGREQHIWGNGFDKLSIQKGVLWIENELIRGHFEHKFRYQNNQFELIGYSYGNSDGLGKLYLIDFNLSTGKRIETIENYSSDTLEERKEKTIKLYPLPDLQHFEPYSNELY